jgi:hypothetical protein
MQRNRARSLPSCCVNKGVHVRKIFIGKRRIAVVGTMVAIIVVSASAAFAYFTSTGSGTGSASVGSAGNWTVTVNNDTTGKLLPGSGNEKVGYTITNPNKGAQSFTTVTAAVATDGSGNVLDANNAGAPVVGCQAAWFNADAGVTSPLAGTSIPKNGNATGTVTVTMTDSGTNQDACENVDPQITVTVDAPAPTQTS